MNPPKRLSPITEIDFSEDKILGNDVLIKINNKNQVSVKCGRNDPHIVLFTRENTKNSRLYIKMDYKSDKAGVLQIFYDYGFGFNPLRSRSIEIKEIDSRISIVFPVIYLPKNKQNLVIRIDPPNDSEFTIFNMEVLKEKSVDKN